MSNPLAKLALENTILNLAKDSIPDVNHSLEDIRVVIDKFDFEHVLDSILQMEDEDEISEFIDTYSSENDLNDSRYDQYVTLFFLAALLCKHRTMESEEGGEGEGFFLMDPQDGE